MLAFASADTVRFVNSRLTVSRGADSAVAGVEKLVIRTRVDRADPCVCERWRHIERRARRRQAGGALDGRQRRRSAREFEIKRQRQVGQAGNARRHREQQARLRRMDGGADFAGRSPSSSRPASLRPRARA